MRGRQQRHRRRHPRRGQRRHLRHRAEQLLGQRDGVDRGQGGHQPHLHRRPHRRAGRPSGRAYPLHRAGGVGSAAGIHATYTVDASSETKNGTWKLRVTDVYTHDTGVVDAWTLTF
ncbi:proprotein convertase P-domain-containing protein [Actinokineospora soli]|uniref:Proprotein convertase P-domain-containing protein n=1 Tax=Actinokineospora soli TaxID=1048753 RepID=A0ABW2TLD1_9PSEU